MDSFTEKSLTATLSREELAYLVHLAGARKILGLDAPIAAILRLDEKDSVYAAVERSLLARGMLYVQEDGHLAAAPALLDLIRLCIKPAYVVQVAVTGADDQYIGWRIVHILPNVTVLHRQPLAGIHELTAVTDAPFDLANLAAALLALDDEAAHRIVLRISCLLQAPPVTNQYTIWSAGGKYWFRETAAGEDDAAPAQKRQVTRDELIAKLHSIGEPIHAISTLSIEPSL